MSPNNLVLIFVVVVTVITFMVALGQVLRPRRPTSAPALAPVPTPSAPAAPSFTQTAFHSACEAADRELHDRLAKGHTAAILGYLQPPARASPDPKA